MNIKHFKEEDAWESDYAIENDIPVWLLLSDHDALMKQAEARIKELERDLSTYENYGLKRTPSEEAQQVCPDCEKVTLSTCLPCAEVRLAIAKDEAYGESLRIMADALGIPKTTFLTTQTIQNHVDQRLAEVVAALAATKGGDVK